ncbi:hypothetical protein HHK36_022918 [Tetracentron sinense]|uniref:Uncharacterized protein n=1 Tax=Tetracentron sinense TaxID=13715 RepID=A0A834YU25_TETSI|nr:hypothetical protein HHK36_022918 [Tetracentron sinense]
MALSFSTAKLLSVVSVAICRRGYAAASQGAVLRMARERMVKKQGEERGMKKEGSETSPWTPDPVTGYYRPENRGAEMDVVELREVLLNPKIKHH